MQQLPTFNTQKDDTIYKDSNPPSRGDVAASAESTAIIPLDRRQWLYVQNKYNLTAREREIAELICQGLQNGSIATHLRIRPDTVKTHTRNIYRKVRVRSKIAMLLRFMTEARETTTEHNNYPSITVD